MSLVRTILLSVLSVLVLAPVTRAQTTYSVDPEHSFVVFNINHLGAGTVWGRFNDPSGTFTVENGAPANLDIQVKADNIDTDNERRDNHLRSPDFFNARQFPLITFKSQSIKPAGEDSYEVTGELTAHGVTKPVTVTLRKVGEASGGPGGERVGYETQLKVNRQDYGIAAMPGGVGDDVNLFIAFEGVKQ